ncbi:MAG: histidinol-phosphate transaminase [Lachnospiraceae bacterium]|uniref:Histidinol-phosphate aminotransferase n=1 Tax=Candidatus Weimeria bifida TaxID=2599074 RepID=A0A6N7IZL8_9FIRM|nr:histidinol-phosphate transaminase [Candidatus Weimeria bifida]RRF96580.1 MAG: histidinol-phosphate transaminase [Lachnospiraceae bacterium]
MSSTWEEKVHKVTPYTPGEQPKALDVIKLNTNENPYPPAPAVKRAIADFDYELLRKYPDPTASGLIGVLSDTYSVPADQIFVGVGSDDVLAMSFLTFFTSGEGILFPDVTYSFYDVWAGEFRIPYETVPLKEDMSLDIDAFCRGTAGGIVIPNPNAPTGLDAGTGALEKIIKSNPQCVVIIDEAYVDFGAESVLPLIDKYDNLLVTQTFSKSRAMAGSRLGFAFGSKKLIKYLNDVKYSFNSYTIDALTQKVGIASLSDPDYFKMRCLAIINERERSKKRFRELGFDFPDSRSNFIFVHHNKVSGEELFKALRDNNIFVRHFEGERVQDFNRVTIGTPEEMDGLFDFLKKYLENK